MPEQAKRIMVVAARYSTAKRLAYDLCERGYEAFAELPAQSLARLAETPVSLVVTDLHMRDFDGFHLLKALPQLAHPPLVIVLCSASAIDAAVQALGQGASLYLVKPFKTGKLVALVERAFEEARARVARRMELGANGDASRIVGSSRAILASLDLLSRVARADVPVLLIGETGTGKGLFARALHTAGSRANKPFVALNCAALPEHLIESELFGHKRGAFTGATHDRRGLFEEADGGTLFLDEIGDLPQPLQARLLHILETGAVRPIGSNREVRVDVRIVAATKHSPHARSIESGLREDLGFRLDVVSIEIPPLRSRRADIPELARHFLAVARSRHPEAAVEDFSPQTMERLTSHFWPGNVRELQHVVERIVLLGRQRLAQPEDLPSTLGEPDLMLRSLMSGAILPVDELTRVYAQWALKQLNGHRGRTAKALDVCAKTLAAWLGGK